MDPVSAIIIGVISLVGTLVGVTTNRRNNQFMEEMNRDNQQFQWEVNERNYQWSKEAAEWEYEHNKPQRQYADLLEAGLTPAAAAQKLSGANVSYSPATAVAPRNMPMSTDLLNDSLSQVIEEIGNYSSMAQAQASAEKTRAETKVINETAIDKATAEIDKILADTLVSYSQKDVADTQAVLNEANTDLVNEKVNTELSTRKGIELSNEEKDIQLDFTRKTLEMSLDKTEAEIKYLSEQTAKLQGEIKSVDFDNKYKEWRNTFIDTFGVAPEQGWQDMLFKAMADGKGDALLDSLSKSLRLIFSDDNPYEYENLKYFEEQIKSGRTLDVQHQLGPWRFSSLKEFLGNFFNE